MVRTDYVNRAGSDEQHKERSRGGPGPAKPAPHPRADEAGRKLPELRQSVLQGEAGEGGDMQEQRSASPTLDDRDMRTVQAEEKGQSRAPIGHMKSDIPTPVADNRGRAPVAPDSRVGTSHTTVPMHSPTAAHVEDLNALPERSGEAGSDPHDEAQARESGTPTPDAAPRFVIVADESTTSGREYRAADAHASSDAAAGESAGAGDAVHAVDTEGGDAADAAASPMTSSHQDPGDLGPLLTDLARVSKDTGIFEVLLPSGETLGVVVDATPGQVRVLLSTSDEQLASRLRPRQMELQGGLERRIGKCVKLAVL